jgi:predicted amidohydrolase
MAEEATLKGQPIQVGVVQFDPQVTCVSENLERASFLMRDAVAKGAGLVVLPELANSGYMFNNREEAYSYAETIPNGPTMQRWIREAKELNIHLVGSLTEVDGVRLYDSAVLIGPNGYVGTYRKTHLWYEEKLFFEPGNLGYPVFETPIGRIGLLVCWDIWFPETFRILNTQGADIVCVPNNWVWTPPPLFDELNRAMATYLTMVNAHVNQMYVACADRVGVERGQKFLGCSVIAGTNGWPIAGPAAPEGEAVLVTEPINLVASRRSKVWNDLNDLARDRRTDLYDEMLGYKLGSRLPR